MDYLEFIARVTSHIPDKGQVTVRYYGLYANAHRGKVKKASQVSVALGMIEEKFRSIPNKGCTEMIQEVFYDVDPLVWPISGAFESLAIILACHEQSPSQFDIS